MKPIATRMAGTSSHLQELNVLGVNLEETRLYRNIVREIKLKVIQRLLAQGLG